MRPLDTFHTTNPVGNFFIETDVDSPLQEPVTQSTGVFNGMFLVTIRDYTNLLYFHLLLYVSDGLLPEHAAINVIGDTPPAGAYFP